MSCRASTSPPAGQLAWLRVMKRSMSTRVGREVDHSRRYRTQAVVLHPAGTSVEFEQDLRSIETFDATYAYMFERLSGSRVGAELALLGKIVQVPEPLFLRRFHAGWAAPARNPEQYAGYLARTLAADFEALLIVRCTDSVPLGAITKALIGQSRVGIGVGVAGRRLGKWIAGDPAGNADGWGRCCCARSGSPTWRWSTCACRRPTASTWDRPVTSGRPRRS